MRKKSVQDYEREARKEGKCLIHPNKTGFARKIYQMRHGELPSTIYVCHTCDNRRCIRDSHHFPGTQADNLQDASRKGRLKAARSRPEVIKNMSDGQIRRYKNQAEHEKQSAGQIRRYKNQAEHEKLSAGQIRRYKNKTEREKTGAAVRHYFEDQSAHEKASIAQMKPEVRKKKSASLKLHFEDSAAREKARDGQLRRWDKITSKDRDAFSKAVTIGQLRRYQDSAEHEKSSIGQLRRFEDAAQRRQASVAAYGRWATRSPEERTAIALKSAATLRAKKKGVKK